MIRRMILQTGAVILVSLAAGALFVLPTGENPFRVIWVWLVAGFGCQGAGGRCALLTAIQYATPLMLTGLSAMVAFRAGLFSIGQFGQMVVGAGAATYLAVHLPGPRFLVLAAAVLGGFAGGALWGGIPGVLRAYLNMPEIIVTILLNPLAQAVVGPVSWMRIPETARLLPLVATTKLSAALFIALAVVWLVYLYFFRHQGGLEIRMAGEAGRFASYAGMRSRWAIVRAMFLSGGLAGLAGGLEVLGVHYRFVSNFSSIDLFDGIAVSLLGHLHPLGITLSALLLGGLRLGSLNGLQLMTDVPRELGNAVIAIMMLLISMPFLFSQLRARMGEAEN